jgi:hypothetical protein
MYAALSQRAFGMYAALSQCAKLDHLPIYWQIDRKCRARIGTAIHGNGPAMSPNELLSDSQA